MQGHNIKENDDSNMWVTVKRKKQKNTQSEYKNQSNNNTHKSPIYKPTNNNKYKPENKNQTNNKYKPENKNQTNNKYKPENKNRINQPNRLNKNQTNKLPDNRYNNFSNQIDIIQSGPKPVKVVHIKKGPKPVKVVHIKSGPNYASIAKNKEQIVTQIINTTQIYQDTNIITKIPICQTKPIVRNQFPIDNNNVSFNTWEHTYFKHIIELAKIFSEGCEKFNIDTTSLEFLDIFSHFIRQSSSGKISSYMEDIDSREEDFYMEYAIKRNKF
jgi:hypothetical protein